jgi:hypothetical protein
MKKREWDVPKDSWGAETLRMVEPKKKKVLLEKGLYNSKTKKYEID